MINYSFPRIETLDDIKDVFKKKEFILVQKDGYQVVNYVFNDKSTFENEIEAECRGLIFDLEGNILARRYHKFFNAGERADLSLDDVTQKMCHVKYEILEKLDGSMISPIPRTDVRHSNEIQFRLGTKMGITDVAMQAETWIADKPEYIRFINNAIIVGVTPIFEWCSPKQRIVLDYKEDTLVLTAIRDNFSGSYHKYDLMKSLAEGYGIPVVKALDKSLTIDQVKSLEDSEGIVIRFDDGHMVKVKSDWYCKIHKVKDDVCSESKVLQLILDEAIDDVLPVLMDEDKARVEAYRKSSLMHIAHFTMGLIQQYFKSLDTIKRKLPCNREMTRKDFAEFIKDEKFKGLLFKMYDAKQEPMPMVIDYVKRHIKKPEEVRDIIGPPYKGMNINE